MGTTDDFAGTSRAIYEQWEKAMGTWWDQVLESPQFLSGLGKNLEAQAQARGAFTKAMDEGLANMHLPTRTDLTRVARIATLLEEKVLAVEDLLLQMGDTMADLQKEVVQARIEAAEARIESREQLAALQARLDALEGNSPKTPSRSRSRKKTTATTEEA
ncbi:MAG: hypothetical protein EP330_06925 [Deltaproteobacteria bacterium]|nr:MAG: hypothetical protein EP330_06925 [Deltaproteobacteria bacterium]